MVKCPDCDGTGLIHSHNPLCGTCGGSGKCSVQAAEEALRLLKIIAKIKGNLNA